MKKYTAIIERCHKTKLYVGYIPGLPGAHSQANTLDELNQNLQEVVEMLLEDGDSKQDGEFVGTQLVEVA
jgi:predicted RNase H-like HicB family nuclease